MFLSYEDDILPDPKIAYEKVCGFLDLEVRNPKVNLRRTNPFDIHEIVENYAELEKTLKNTKYEWMLYE